MREPLRNTFQWSVSRDRCFVTCPRQYWFNHYGFWGGWEPTADDRTREIYMLKQLKTRPVWVGDVVHACIRRSLENLSRRIPLLPVEEILRITRDRMRIDFRQSRDGLYREDPKAACGLYEHEYRVPVTDAEWLESAEQVDQCLRNFYASEAFSQLARTRPEDFLEIETFSRLAIDGVPVVVKLDCATRESDHVVVWDWKTGRRETQESPLQLACYAFYVHQEYGIPIHRVRQRRVDLMGGGDYRETVIGERRLDEVLTYIRGSVADMMSLLDDPERNLASEDRFTKAVRRDVCSRCSFLRVCKPPLPVSPG
ncbi:MAG TPA: PD-(D/E)XK nuclease family protein [Candidatus Krumholzibacteria bacterium]|nr:PD-(D/E)XK nuclease family protein [Candidatus Krumholzibacteria bacterium]